MNYYLCNQDYVINCADSLGQNVDLSSLLKSCFVEQITQKESINKKKLIKSIEINVIPATGNITTSIIDGDNVTFTSATGSIIGNSKKIKAEKSPLALADPTITSRTVSLYTGNATIGSLTVTGVNKVGVVFTDICKLWFSAAGQNKVRGK